MSKHVQHSVAKLWINGSLTPSPEAPLPTKERAPQKRKGENLKEYYTLPQRPVVPSEPPHGPPHTNEASARTEDPSTNQRSEPCNRANERAGRSRRTNGGSEQASSDRQPRKSVIQGPRRTVPQGGHRSRSPLSRVAKDRGTMARVANPYSENEYSDNEDQDYTIVGSREGTSSF